MILIDVQSSCHTMNKIAAAVLRERDEQPKTHKGRRKMGTEIGGKAI